MIASSSTLSCSLLGRLLTLMLGFEVPITGVLHVEWQMQTGKKFTTP